MTLSLDHRTRVLLAVVLMLALLAGGWLLGAQPALAAAFDAAGQRAAVETQNEAARAQLARLEKASADTAALEDRLSALSDSVPASTDTSALLAALDAAAAESGVRVDRFTVDAGTPYTAPTGGEGADAGASDAAAPVDPSVVPYADSRITAENLVVVPVSVDVTGDLDGVLAFVERVQSGDRLFLVSRLTSVADASQGSGVQATVAGSVYVLRDADAQGPAAG